MSSQIRTLARGEGGGVAVSLDKYIISNVLCKKIESR